MARPRRNASVVVAEAAARSIGRGHPWVYGELPGAREVEPGDVIDLARTDGSFVARAIADPRGGIAARVLGRDPSEAVDAAFVSRRLRRALDVRRSLVASEATTAYRAVNGEGDHLPGLVVDRYGDVAIVRTDGEGPARFVERFKAAIVSALEEAGVRSIALRVAAREGDGKIAPWAGEPPPSTIVVREHGMAMEVDLVRGQKTGAFLDQRENRRRVRGFANGRRTLNLFSYAGGFSVAAALGGAPEVTSVDVAAGAHASAQRSFRANGLDPAAHSFVTADAFAFLESARDRGERWDLVVSDPPSFAPSERAKPKALAAYRRLHALCASVLGDGAIFCAASCSSHVPTHEFLGTLDEAALARPLRVVDVFGQPPDHPTLPAHAEARYLKLVVLAGA